jgi:hypothetical protein
MKKYILFILLIFLSINIFAQSIFILNGLEWYSSLDNVINNEGEPNSSDEIDIFRNIRYSNKEIAGSKANIEYKFVLNKLIEVTYNFSDIQINNVITIFYGLRNKLTELYGNYDQDYDKKKGNRSKIFPRDILLENLTTEEIIKFISEGREIYDTYEWIYNRTVIDLSVSQFFILRNIQGFGAFEIELPIILRYKSPNYYDIIKEADANKKK